MEVIRERKGRVHAGGHRTRPVTVHYRAVPVLTDGDHDLALRVVQAAILFGPAIVTGIVEGSTWPM